jgi:hypothetical protein
LEKKVFRLRRVWISINIADKFLSTAQILDSKTSKKCYHISVLEAVVRLAFGV